MTNFAAPLISFLLISSSCEAAFAPSGVNKRTRSLSNKRATKIETGPFNLPIIRSRSHDVPQHLQLSASSTKTETPVAGFIETELRGAAMKLHTRAQSPKEGQVEEVKKAVPYIPTHADYLSFLVDSKYVYETLEEIVNSTPDLEMFHSTGLERTIPLEKDIRYMIAEYDLTRPDVGTYGSDYANKLRLLVEGGDGVPEFMCHFYNYYFAHTAGGRMIGKQMSALLLNKLTLDFYKWDGNLNEIKSKVKNDIEAMVSTWTREQKDKCVGETMDAFRFGGAINAYLSGGKSGH